MNIFVNKYFSLFEFMKICYTLLDTATATARQVLSDQKSQKSTQKNKSSFKKYTKSKVSKKNAQKNKFSKKKMLNKVSLLKKLL